MKYLEFLLLQAASLLYFLSYSLSTDHRGLPVVVAGQLSQILEGVGETLVVGGGGVAGGLAGGFAEVR